jgi:hypothetical protein
MKLTVQMPASGRFTTEGLPHLPRRLFQLFPQLHRHRCDNAFGYSFREECQDTEIPHVLEHLIIELQSQVEPDVTLRGETVWNWRRDPRGRFHVYIGYRNEMVALACMRLAERIVHAIDAHELDRLDIAGEMAHLQQIARLSRSLTDGLPEPAAAPSWSAAPEPMSAVPV